MKWLSIEAGIVRGRVLAAPEPKHDRKTRWPVAADASGQVAVEAEVVPTHRSVTDVIRHLLP